jgi:hypothetical protein
MAQVIVVAEGIEIRDVGQGTRLLAFLNAECDAQKGSVWTYPKGAKGKPTHEVRVVYDMAEFTKALDMPDTFVVYEGHSRYGQGPAFGPALTPKVPDKKAFPTNPWGVHFRMGFDATDTECIGDLVEHSVTPVEYDLPKADAKSFLPDALVAAAGDAKKRADAIASKKIKVAAVCGTRGAWRLFDTCESGQAATTTARGDQPLKGRHFYARLTRPSNEFLTAVKVGSADLDKSNLKCRILFMASCSSHVHFYKPLRNRRKAIKSACKFLLTAQVCATSHARTFLEQVLLKGNDPTTRTGIKKLLKALNGASKSGIVGAY